MSTGLRLVHHAQEDWLRDFESAVNRIELREPSTWLAREYELEEKMLQEATIRHAVDHRTALVAGRDYTLVPKREDRDSSKVAVEVAMDCLEELEQFAEARKRLSRAFLHGTCYEQIKCQPFQRDIGDGVVRTWHLPVALEHREKWLYRKTIDGAKTVNPKATWKRWAIYGPQAGLWHEMTAQESASLVKHVFADEMGGLGYGRPLRDALAMIWYAMTHTHKETLQAIERFAQGLAIMKIDGLRDGATGNTNAAVQTKALSILKKMMARNGLVLDSEDNLEVIEGSGTGHEMLSNFRQELRDQVFTLILSANLPTGASEGGSYALADVQEGSTETLVQFDRCALEETLSRHLLGYIWDLNRANMMELGIMQDRPKFDLMQERREDPEVASRVLLGATQIGLPVALADAYKKLNLRQPGPDEDLLEPPAPAASGGFGMGGGFGAGIPGFEQDPQQADPFGQDQNRGMPTPNGL